MAVVKRDRSKEKICLCSSKEKMIFVMRKKSTNLSECACKCFALSMMSNLCLYFRTIHGGTFDYVRIKSQCL